MAMASTPQQHAGHVVGAKQPHSLAHEGHSIHTIILPLMQYKLHFLAA